MERTNSRLRETANYGTIHVVKASFTTRPALLKDAEKIFALIHRHRDELIIRPLSGIVENIDRFIVAEEGGRMVGCAAYAILPEFGTPLHATVEIQSVAVLSTMRRKGIGKALVEAILGRVESFRPAEALVLTFAPEFFTALGFVEIPKTQIMHKLYTGCINCTKHADPYTCPEIAMRKTLA